VVRISEDLRRCVVFLGGQKEGPADEAPIDPQGVGFLLVGRQEDGGGTYLVTAKHVATNLHAPFVIRFNEKGGGSRLHHIEMPDHIRWSFHRDPGVDLAVAPIDRPEWSDNLGYHLDDLIKYREIATETGPGDSVYISGLFHFVHGSKRNLPVVYKGSVALLPSDDDPIPVDGAAPTKGYLVQANPISGCSGAPVWVPRAVQIEPPQVGNERIVFWTEGSLTLLGFWSSSWKVRGSEIVAVAPDHDSKGALAPLGMGVVQPAEKLIEIFEQTDVAKERRQMHERAKSERSSTHDFRAPPSVSAHPVTEGDEQHKERFTALLDAALGKPKQGD